MAGREWEAGESEILQQQKMGKRKGKGTEYPLGGYFLMLSLWELAQSWLRAVGHHAEPSSAPSPRSSTGANRSRAAGPHHIPPCNFLPSTFLFLERMMMF